MRTQNMRCRDYTTVKREEGTWHIFREERRVGKIFEHEAYNYRPRFSIRELVWAGPFPQGYPKNPDAVLAHDGGPFDTRQECLTAFADRADKLLAWRAAQKNCI